MSLFTALGAINALKVAFYPYLPFSCERLNRFLGFDGEVASGGWQTAPVPAGQPLRDPEPLFRKLEPPAEEQ
jgi:methionyl-tRNA synthetase